MSDKEVIQKANERFKLFNDIIMNETLKMMRSNLAFFHGGKIPKLTPIQKLKRKITNKIEWAKDVYCYAKNGCDC
jgi:hypothetical protein